MLLLHPYSLYGSIQVSEHCIITFSIGSYTPMAWFHIVPMISCHILLGHPWFDSNKVWNNNAFHVHSFICKYRKYSLHACTQRTFRERTSELHGCP